MSGVGPTGPAPFSWREPASALQPRVPHAYRTGSLPPPAARPAGAAVFVCCVLCPHGTRGRHSPQRVADNRASYGRFRFQCVSKTATYRQMPAKQRGLSSVVHVFKATLTFIFQNSSKCVPYNQTCQVAALFSPQNPGVLSVSQSSYSAKPKTGYAYRIVLYK